MKVIADDYEWSTHQPLIHLGMEFFKPELVVELGIGLFSTPLFKGHKPKSMISVENSEEWIEKMKEEIEFGDDHQLLHHQFSGEFNQLSNPRLMTKEQEAEIADYYKDLASIIEDTHSDPKLLFVDNYGLCRRIAIDTVGPMFDVVIYHDCQPRGVQFYNYRFNKRVRTRFISYVLTTKKSWTGMLVSLESDTGISAMQEAAEPFIQAYCDENNLRRVDVQLMKWGLM
jgi:hypothetical protein